MGAFRSACLALLVSCGAHLLLALGLAVALTRLPQPDVASTLDLTRVELCLTEKTDGDAAPVCPPSEQSFCRRMPPAPEKPPEPGRETPRAPEPPELELRSPDETAPVEMACVAAAATQPTVAADAPSQAQVDAPPEPLWSIRPDYPRAARLRGEQGDVRLAITVDAVGSVASAKVVSSCGFPELDAAALSAVRKARFTPARANGRSVVSTVGLSLRFRLR